MKLIIREKINAIAEYLIDMYQPKKRNIKMADIDYLLMITEEEV